MCTTIEKKLIFIKQLCEDSSVCVGFLSNVFFIKDLSTRANILIRNTKDGLCIISFPSEFIFKGTTQLVLFN